MLTPLLRLDAILGVLTEAARASCCVRVVLREPPGRGRPLRIVEGVVLEVSDGRDRRTRVRLAIPIGVGDPVEVRLLVESIAEVEVLAPAGSGTPGRELAAAHRPAARAGAERARLTEPLVADWSPEQTGRRRRAPGS